MPRGCDGRDPGTSPLGSAPRSDRWAMPDPAHDHARSLPKRQDPCNTVLNFLSFHEWVLCDLMMTETRRDRSDSSEWIRALEQHPPQVIARIR